MSLKEELDLLEAIYIVGADGKLTKKGEGEDDEPEQDAFWSKLFAKKDKPPEGKPSKSPVVGSGPSGEKSSGSYKSKSSEPYKAPAKWISAGGVVLGGKDDLDHVWIRKAKGAAYGGWTFAKGRVDKGESREQAALREVEEEMGIVAEIASGGYLGEYDGSMSVTHYYVMFAKRNLNKHDDETEKIMLASWTEAVHKFSKSGNTRDIKALTKAMDYVEKLKRKQAGKEERR